MAKKNRKSKNNSVKKEGQSFNASNIYSMSETERKLFDILIEPENIRLNKSELALKANISRPTLNKLLKKKEFMDEVNYEFSDFMFNNIFKIYQAMFISASSEGKDGFQDRKLLLEMLGKHQESIEVKTTTEQLVYDIKPTDIKQEKEEFNTRYHTRGGF